MQVKAASVTSLSDARFFSAAGADFIGFCFDALQANAVSLDKAKAIAAWLHQPVLVGEFGKHQAADEIEFIAREMGLSEIQIPFDHPDKDKLSFRKFLGVEDWKDALTIKGDDVLLLKVNVADLQDAAFLTLIKTRNVFLEISKEEALFAFLKDHPEIAGIQIGCSLEEKPGLSAVDEYAEILERLGL